LLPDEHEYRDSAYCWTRLRVQGPRSDVFQLQFDDLEHFYYVQYFIFVNLRLRSRWLFDFEDHDMQYSIEHVNAVPVNHIDALSIIDGMSFSNIVVFFIPW